LSGGGPGKTEKSQHRKKQRWPNLFSSVPVIHQTIPHAARFAGLSLFS
jgi:hypothetical protein